jgi:hypothetical protein
MVAKILFKNTRHLSWRRSLAARLAAACIVLFCVSLHAQETGLEHLPEPRYLAAALSDPASRVETLLTMAAVARLLDYGSQTDPARHGEIEARFRDERAWLDRLAGRFGELPMSTALLDPAAWYLQLELDQQQLAAGLLVSPLGPGDQSLMRQLFDRTDERLAAALLPEILARMERQSTILWRALLEQLPTNPALAEAVIALNADWFEPWIAAEPPAPDGEADGGADAPDVVDGALAGLQAIAMAAMSVGPPDELRLKRLRFNLLMAQPELDPMPRIETWQLLALATAVDGLYQREYLAFTETLLSVASDYVILELLPEDIPGTRIPRVLTDLLPGLSNVYARDFGEVDPRINASLAAVFDVMQYLQTGTAETERILALRREVADSVAQFVLLIPDLNYYFEQPVRERIAEEVDVCISIVANRDAGAVGALSREQFDGCLATLIELASEQLNRAELAGDPDGPFGAEQLRRELKLTPWQRINYVLGYLHERHPSGCDLPAEPLPNPLEWSTLATVITWFAQQAPVYLQTPENEARINGLRQYGMRLLDAWVQQVDCISGAGTGINDPVSRGLADYRQALDELASDLREAELQFRADRLKPGSDVVLHGDAGQRTAFRTEGLQIGPCDPAQSCEMTAGLEATRALIGLFPDTYLIADQTAMGQVEICYENMEWVNRRSDPVRAEDPHVANYYGNLSFDLVGRYRERDTVTDVFGFNFVSPGEYHYLFAAATEEVLQDGCPMEWVGSRVVTGLPERDGIRVVPDRLTYLAAARTLPSQIIAANWSRNEEWRDHFVTGLDVTPYEYAPDPAIADRVTQHLRTLYQAEQVELYNALLRPQARGASGNGSALFERLEELTAQKSLVRSYMNLFYPQLMLDSGDIRGALEGRGSLLDRQTLRRFREANIAVPSISETGIARLERFQALWSRQPELMRRSGSSATSLAHAITRLNSLYFEFFVQPRVAPQPPRAVTFSGGVRG